jgi:cytochrome P450 family 4
MENVSTVSSCIFKELPHLLESWLNITLNITSQINSGFVNILHFFSGGWLDNSFEYMQTLGRGLNMFSVWWILSIVLLFALFLHLSVAHYPTQKRLRAFTSNIPGPLTLPILGNVPTFAACNLVQFFQKLVATTNKYGPIVRFWMGNKLYIVISDAESIESLLTSKAMITKNAQVSKILNGSGITLANNDKWKIHRRIISSTFNGNVLHQFMGSFVQNSLVLIQKLKSLADGSSFNIYPVICACTLDIICETVTGTNINNYMEGDDVFMKNMLRALEKELEGTYKKPWVLNEWMHNRRKGSEGDKETFVDYLREFIDNVVTEKLESRPNGFQHYRGNLQVEYLQWVRGREMCLLDLLIQDDQLSVEEIKEELCTLIVAGTKVTAVTCCFALSLLGVYQEVQHRVLEEQEKIFGSDIHRAATSKDLSDMKYLEQVFCVLIGHSIRLVYFL